MKKGFISLLMMSAVMILFGCSSINSKVLTDKKILKRNDILKQRYPLIVNVTRGSGTESFDLRNFEWAVHSMLVSEGMNVVPYFSSGKSGYTNQASSSEKYLLVCNMKVQLGKFNNESHGLGNEWNIYKASFQTDISSDWYIVDMNEVRNKVKAMQKEIDDKLVQIGGTREKWNDEKEFKLLKDHTLLFLTHAYSKRDANEVLYHVSIFSSGYPQQTDFNSAIAPSINADVDKFFTSLTGLKSYWDRRKK